jgi:hypothetical protein
VLRRTHGPVQTKKGWELEIMIGRRYTKIHKRVQRIKLWGHFDRMENTKTVRKITDWNPMGVRSKGRPKIGG